MKFQWDATKERTNRKKHGITFSEACLVFGDAYLLNLFDGNHSEDEERWITMGQTPDGKIIVVSHTYRGGGAEEAVRIISARKTTKNETHQYFERR